MPARPARKHVVALFCLGVLLSLVPLQEDIHRSRPEKFDLTRQAQRRAVNVGITPALIASLGGFRPLAADILWLKADHVWHGGSWWQMLPLLESIVELDPNFLLAWKVYGWHCAYNLHAESKTAIDRNYWLNKGIEVLERGVEANPNSWEMKWELAWTLYDRAHELHRAADMFYEASKLPGAQPYVSRFYYRAYERLLDHDGIFRGLAYAATQFPEDEHHQFLVRRDTNYWRHHWNDPWAHRKLIVQENTARYQRGIKPYLYPGNPFWDVCPVCGMPVKKSPTAVCENLACPNYKQPIHREDSAAGRRSSG